MVESGVEEEGLKLLKAVYVLFMTQRGIMMDVKQEGTTLGCKVLDHFC